MKSAERIMWTTDQDIIVGYRHRLGHLPDRTGSYYDAVGLHHQVFLRPKPLAQPDPRKPPLSHQGPLHFSDHTEHARGSELEHVLLATLALQPLDGCLAVCTDREAVQNICHMPDEPCEEGVLDRELRPNPVLHGQLLHSEQLSTV